MNKKLKFIFIDKKIYKAFLYLLIFFVIIFSVYFFIPKFFNYTPNLINKSLNENSNINIKNISNVNYNFFPSPRLRLTGSNLVFGDNILEVNEAEVDIVLNPLSVINYKILEYNKLIVKGGSTIIKINKVNQLYRYIKKNQKKITFEKNNIILLKDKKKLFEVNKSKIYFDSNDTTQQINIKGLFFNHETFFILKKQFGGKTKITLKIPDLDILTKIILENKNNSRIFEGAVNFEVINNFFQFNFTKEKNFKINNGFIRSNLTNSLFEGKISLNPYFTFNLSIEPSTFSIEKLILIIQQKYFLEDPEKVKIIKNIDGSLNFKKNFEGNVIFKNREILFQNFKVGGSTKIFFDAKITKFGKKGKIQFNLTSRVKSKKTAAKDLKILGYIIPSISKVNFDKIIFDNEIFAEKKIKKYEDKFKYEVIKGSISNIFNEKKLENFFKNF